MDPAERLTGPTNELAKERNRAAAERTLSAWINNSLTLVGFGLAIDPIFNKLRLLFPQQNLITTDSLSHIISLSFMIVGIGLLIIAMFQHYLAIQSLERHDYVFIPSTNLNILAVVAVIAFGLSGLLTILLGFF